MIKINGDESLAPEEEWVEQENQLTEKAEDIESLKVSLAEEKEKVERYLANWQRAQADFENFKKRNEQERSEIAKFGNTTLIMNLLPVLDDLERAFASLAPNSVGLTWIDGIKLIHGKLEAALEAQGLSEIQAVGQDFDPNLHDAVIYRDGAEGKVIEELQKGYKLHDRVIRPTMVVVGKGEEKQEETG